MCPVSVLRGVCIEGWVWGSGRGHSSPEAGPKDTDGWKGRSLFSVSGLHHLYSTLGSEEGTGNIKNNDSGFSYLLAFYSLQSLFHVYQYLYLFI